MAKRGKKIAEPETPTVTSDVPDEVTTDKALYVPLAVEEFSVPTLDERVAEVFSAPAPVETPAIPETLLDEWLQAAVSSSEAKSWHAEAAEILELAAAGNAVSPSRVVSCVRAAVGLVPKA